MHTNPRNSKRMKKSGVYPEAWSEFMCDLKALEAIMSDEAEFDIDKIHNTINIIGYTPEGIKIRAFYDIKNKRIKSHYPELNEERK